MKRLAIIAGVCALTVIFCAAWRGAFDDNYFKQAEAVAAGATATGGTITTNGGYIIHTFTNVGLDNFIVSGGSLSCDVLIVAGGGGGGSQFAGGGGAGGVSNIESFSATSGVYYISVGPGGLGANNADWAVGSNGWNTTCGVFIAYGGGRGGGSGHDDGLPGGSGGGSGGNAGAAGYAGTNGQGFAGGTGLAGEYPGGGGGGASEVGQSPLVANQGGKGGEGINSSISGSAHIYGSGGCGSVLSFATGSLTNGIGGTGAGSGAVVNYDGGAGTVTRYAGGGTYYGCGGGGGGWDGSASPTPAGAGFQGCVIVRYAQ